MPPDARPAPAAESREHQAFWAIAPLIFVVLWAGGFSFGRLGLASAEPLTLLTLRYGLAVLVLMLFLLWRRPRWPTDVKHWACVILTGFLLHCLYFGLAYLAMKEGMNAGATAIIMALQPAIVAAMAPVMRIGKAVGRMLWLGIGLGFSGVAVTVAENLSKGFSAASTVSGSYLLATCLALAALGGISFATLFEKWHGRTTDPLAGGLIQYSTGFLVLLPAAFMSETMQIDWQPSLFLSLAYLVVANSLVSIWIYIELIGRGDATRVASLMFLVPPLAVIMAWAILGEALSVTAFAGLVFAAAGVYIVKRQTE